MAYFSVGDPKTVVACPYDSTHMVRNKRMQYHLIDCRKVSTSQLCFADSTLLILSCCTMYFADCKNIT